jgi:hypothetical protein
MPGLTLALAVLLAATMFASPVMAQGLEAVEFDEDDFAVSYSYAAVMGTGTYKIHGRRITMLQIPVAITQREMSEEQFGMKWYLPVTIGYDQVNDNSWLENIFEEELVTLTAMPGFEAQLPLDDVWTLKPFGKLGGTYDFTREEFIVLGVVGLRARGTWRFDDGSEFRWGGGLQLAGEYQFETYVSHGFSILETGVDYRRDTGFNLLERKVNAGVYYHFQHYAPIWDIAETPIRDSEIHDLHEFGVSVGLKRPRKIFGFSVERVRIGYKTGTGFEGWTFGTDFPI